MEMTFLGSEILSVLVLEWVYQAVMTYIRRRLLRVETLRKRPTPSFFVREDLKLGDSGFVTWIPPTIFWRMLFLGAEIFVNTRPPRIFLHVFPFISLIDRSTLGVSKKRLGQAILPLT